MGMSQPNMCECGTCGYRWKKGQDGSHSCSENMAKSIENNRKLEKLTDELIEQRDYWEKKAAELANLVGEHFGESVGEFTSVNCPVQNAIDLFSET